MAEFTGECIIPGQVDPDLLNEHVARYAFAARLTQAKRVLDAGCGAGYGSAELAKSALAVFGVDQSSEALAHAREHYRLPNLRFVQASCSALPHPDASFDLVVAFEVIEHLKQWQEFLLEVRRVLVPAGQFIVSTPNKLYYGESRGEAGPNPFHVHEFDFAEFRNELSSIFPHISLFLENHVAGVVFQPVESADAAEVRIAGAAVTPPEAHFFIAVCSHRPLPAHSSFVYIPRVANLLRERERHIDRLEAEISTKTDWLESATREHQKLVEMFREQQSELEARNRWAEQLNRELESSGARVRELQEELAREQAEARRVVSDYEAKVSELEQENRSKTEWALETERRLGKELEAKCQELAQCVEHLHDREKTIEERTAWVHRLQGEVDALEKQLSLYKASRWVKMGQRLGLGPSLPAN